jgi:hypothetical protein
VALEEDDRRLLFLADDEQTAMVAIERNWSLVDCRSRGAVLLLGKIDVFEVETPKMPAPRSVSSFDRYRPIVNSALAWSINQRPRVSLMPRKGHYHLQVLLATQTISELILFIDRLLLWDSPCALYLLLQVFKFSFVFVGIIEQD